MGQVAKTMFQNLSNHFYRKTCQVANQDSKLILYNFNCLENILKMVYHLGFKKKKVSISKIINIIFTYFCKIELLSNHY